MHTPWGQSQDSERTHVAGLSFESTASHGGFRVSGPALAQLSPAAKKRGEGDPSRCLWYEEDCAWAVAIWDLQAFGALYPPERSIEDKRAETLQCLSSWNPDYLREVGVEPIAEFEAQWMERQEDHRRREAKDPDLVISAAGDWHADVPEGCVGVWTADDSFHLVTKQSYKDRTGLNLLSKLEVV